MSSVSEPTGQSPGGVLQGVLELSYGLILGTRIHIALETWRMQRLSPGLTRTPSTGHTRTLIGLVKQSHSSQLDLVVSMAIAATMGEFPLSMRAYHNEKVTVGFGKAVWTFVLSSMMHLLSLGSLNSEKYEMIDHSCC